MIIAVSFTHDIHPTFARFALETPGLSNAPVYYFDRSTVVERFRDNRDAVRSFVEADEAYLLTSAELQKL